MESNDLERKRRPRPEGAEGEIRKRRPRPEGAEGEVRKRRPRPEGAEGEVRQRRPRPEGAEGEVRKRRPRPEGAEGEVRKRRPRPEGAEGEVRKRRPRPEGAEGEVRQRRPRPEGAEGEVRQRRPRPEDSNRNRKRPPKVADDIEIVDVFDRAEMEEEMKRNRNSKKKKKHSPKKHLVGIILSLISIIIALVFYYLLTDLGVLPGKYMTVIAVVLALFCLLALGLQFTKKKGYILGIIISILISLICGIGGFYIHSVTAAMKKVGGASYKTDNMVMVVRKDDPAKDLKDVKGYKVGFQTAIDEENTKKMKKELKGETDRLKQPQLSYQEFGTLDQLGQALLDKKIDAVIYNEPFTDTIDEMIEGYADKVKVIYKYGIHTEIKEEEKAGVDKPFSVYISGIDVYGSITSNSRSDVNIIMTLNPKTKQILLTTTPRDYYVPIPGISGGAKDKLTHAGIYGVDRSMATLESIYDIDLQYYARVNFTSLIKMVDVLGGIDVNSEYAFNAVGYSFKKGMNHLDGEKALVFARERHSFAAGDNQRGRNQEAIIEAMIHKAMSPAILKNANELISSVSDSVETNMTQKEMSQLIRMQLDEGGDWNIESVNAVGSGDKQSCYSSGRQKLYVMHPNWESVHAITDKMKAILAQ